MIIPHTAREQHQTWMAAGAPGRQVLPDWANTIHDTLVASQPTPALSPRMTQVQNLLRQGLSNKAIAQQLQISPDTVKDHLSRLYDRHRVSGRHELRLKLGPLE